MQRRPDWLPRLEAYVEATRRQPFAYGTENGDCTLWVAGAVAAMTGEDLAAPYRGRYRTKGEGVTLLRAKGFADHRAIAAALLEPIPLGHAAPGDVVELPGETLGILQGRFVWALSETAGVVLIPAEEAVRAFRV